MSSRSGSLVTTPCPVAPTADGSVKTISDWVAGNAETGG
jgi:hypothetical protein